MAFNQNPGQVDPRTEASVCGIILAGGQSRRMGGENKALVTVGGLRVVERVVAALSPVFRDLLIVTNSPDEYSFLHLPMVADLLPGNGSLGGLYTGLQSISCRYGFVVACDMPFLNTAVIRVMLQRIGSHDVVVPRIRGHLEPLHAVYARSCLPFIRDLISRGDLKIFDFYNRIDALILDESEFTPLDPEIQFILNVNRPEDLERARKLAAMEAVRRRE
jgi:molybdenum cofactor guanylyltransferase